MNKLFTPGNVGVSSEHVWSISDDGYRVRFSITSAVEGTGIPTMSGSAVAQRPVTIISNSRRKILIQRTPKI